MLVDVLEEIELMQDKLDKVHQKVHDQYYNANLE